MYRLDAVAHHPPQQTDKSLSAQAAFIGAVPEPTTGRHRRGGADRLALAGAFDHRRLPLHRPGPAMNGIRPKPRFIPEIPLTTGGLGLFGNVGEGFPMPLLNRRRIALIGPLQRLLRGQAKPGEPVANRRPAKPDAELLFDQAGHHRAGPHPRLQAIFARIMAIDPAEHLPPLARCQAARASPSRTRSTAISRMASSVA